MIIDMYTTKLPGNKGWRLSVAMSEDRSAHVVIHPDDTHDELRGSFNLLMYLIKSLKSGQESERGT
jgi:hypothetical protein